MKRNAFYIFLIFGLTSLLMLGCASPNKADIPSTADPRAEIAQLKSDLNSAVLKNVDVLATSDYEKSRKYLNDAQDDLNKGKDQSKILDSLRISKGYLNEAYSKAGNKESQAPGLFAARQMAIKAGAGSALDLRNDFSKIDSKISGQSEKLNQIDAEDLTDYQNQYMDLERRAVVISYLGQVKAVVIGAGNDKAKKLAPVTYKKAELSLNNAESIISTNVRNPEGFKPAVARATQDAIQLQNVMYTISQNGNTLAESAAVKIVAQNKTISALEKGLADEAARAQAIKNELESENNKLASDNDKLANDKNKLATEFDSKNQQLTNANKKVRLQQALESARSQFSNSEAEAYQQGDHLVIRLKQINFASGKSDLPSAAMPLLAKVLDIAKNLNTSEITVEGHTDSIGTEAANKSISENRASAVATYFKTNGLASVDIDSEGFGYAKPIATNKSKEGRAQNRRVDVILSPNTTVE
jgi:OmpA-OmpF porin, OOP family